MSDGHPETPPGDVPAKDNRGTQLLELAETQFNGYVSDFMSRTLEKLGLRVVMGDFQSGISGPPEGEQSLLLQLSLDWELHGAV